MEVVLTTRVLQQKKNKRLMKIRQRRVSRKQKGSKNRSKAQLRASKLHNRIQQRRESYQWDVANQLSKELMLLPLKTYKLKT
jgi:putative transposase